MGFSLSLDGGRLEWSGTSCRTIFAQKRNFFSPSFLWMLREILRFNRQCVEDRDAGQLAHRSIGDYLEHRKFSAAFRDNYLIPMAAAIWSTPRIKMLDYPAAAFVSFFENHRLDPHASGRPGAPSPAAREDYLRQAARAARPARIRLRRRSKTIIRDAFGVTVWTRQRPPERFDHVVIAAHSDQALAMLGDPSPAETKHPVGDPLPAEPRGPASRPAADAEAARRLVGLELSALERRRRRERGLRHLLDEPPARHRRPHAALRLAQSGDRAARGADLRRMELRASAVRRARAVGAGAARRHPGRAPHLLCRRLDGARLPRGRPALRPRRGDRARRRPCHGAAATAEPRPNSRWPPNEEHRR